MLTITPQCQIPLRELHFNFVRSSGPGGQNVNKVNSKAVLSWNLMASPSVPDDIRQRLAAQQRRRLSKEGELVITSQRYRDQGRNVADCLEKLRAMLTEAAAPPVIRKETKPTKAAKRRRLTAKRQQSEKKQRRRTRPRLDD